VEKELKRQTAPSITSASVDLMVGTWEEN
jgi:hypothetical protein